MLLSMIRAAREASDAVISIEEDEEDDELAALPFEKIPGLPYTRLERIASVRRGMEDIRAGRTKTMEEVRAMFPRP